MPGLSGVWDGGGGWASSLPCRARQRAEHAAYAAGEGSGGEVGETLSREEGMPVRA